MARSAQQVIRRSARINAVWVDVGTHAGNVSETNTFVTADTSTERLARVRHVAFDNRLNTHQIVKFPRI